MNRKYITTFALGFLAIIGWNIFLIQRDERMYDAYYGQQTVQQVK